MIKIHRIWTLARLDIKRIVQSRVSLWFFYLPFGITTIADLGLGWNGRSTVLFTIPLESCCDSRDKAILGILHEHFSWVWIFIAFTHLLPQLLFRLQDSFLVSQSLWLRFTPCLPYEVAISRALQVIFYGIWIGILGIIWALINSLIHQVSFTSLLLDVLGVVSYVILSGGIVSILDFGLALGYSERRVIPIVALFVPILFLIVYPLIKDSPYERFFPYASPLITGSEVFTELFGGVMIHFIMAIVVGILFLGLHIINKKRYFRVELNQMAE